MTEPFRIEIIDDLLTLLDPEGNGCDAYVLRCYKTAKRRLERWRKDHPFDEKEALRKLGDFFEEAIVDVTVNNKMEKIAKLILDIPTLEPRNLDSLDFHDLHVARIELALRVAYEVGRGAMK